MQRTYPKARAACWRIGPMSRSRSEDAPVRHLAAGREDGPVHRNAPEWHVDAGAAVVDRQQTHTGHAQGTTVVCTGPVHGPFDCHVAVQPLAQDTIRPRTDQQGQHQEGSKGGTLMFPVQNMSPSGAPPC